MTGLAGLGCHKMTVWLARCSGPVMAGGTIAGHICMIHARAFESPGAAVTGLTGRRCRDVVAGLASGGLAIVAARAVPRDT